MNLKYSMLKSKNPNKKENLRPSFCQVLLEIQQYQSWLKKDKTDCTKF